MRFAIHCIFLAALIAGCSGGDSKKSKSSSSDDNSSSSGSGSYGGGGTRGNMADILPVETVAYIRMANVPAVKRDFVQSEHVNDSSTIQREFEKLLDTAFVREAGDHYGLFGSSGETMKNAFAAAESIHLALVVAERGYQMSNFGNRIDPATGRPDPNAPPPEINSRLRPIEVVIVELGSMQTVDDHLKKIGDQVQTKEIDGLTIYTRKEGDFWIQPEALCKLDDRTLIVAGTDTALEKILATKKAGAGGSLGGTSGFREAYSAYGDEGDLFAYVSFDEIRKHEPEVPTMFSTLAGYGDVGGEATVRVTTGNGKEFPAFLTGRAKTKKFLDHIPADAVYVVDSTAEGGRQTRDAFFAWLKEEIDAPDGLLKNFPPDVKDSARKISEMSGNLERDMVVQDPTMLLFAIPVQSEIAMYVAPDRDGKWGMAMFCDVEEQSKAEMLVTKLKDLGAAAPIPLNWETESVGGTTIHYIDIAKMAPPGAMPEQVTRSIDMQVGYALNNELLLVGTVGAIKFALDPSGPTYADKINWDGVDRDNMMLLSLAPGSFVHRNFGIPEMDAVLQKIAKVIPRDANYTLSLNVEPREATLRTNVPISSLVGWLSVEFAGENGPAGLQELTGGRRNAAVDSGSAYGSSYGTAPKSYAAPASSYPTSTYPMSTYPPRPYGSGTYPPLPYGTATTPYPFGSGSTPFPTRP